MRRLLLVTGLLLTAWATPAFGAVAPAAPPVRPQPFAGATPKIAVLPVAPGARLNVDDGARLVLVLPQQNAQDDAGAILDLARQTVRPISLAAPFCRPPESQPGRSSALVVVCDVYAGQAFTSPFDAAAWTPISLRTTPIQSGPLEIWPLAAGHHWIAVRWQDPKGAETAYVSRGGDGRSLTDDALGAHAVASLDRTALARPLCAPLRRTPHYPTADDISNGTDAYAPYLYDRPWGVSITGGDGARGTRGTRVQVQRCGSRRAVTVCRAQCTGISLQDARLAWSTGADGFVRDLRTGRTTRVHVPGHAVQLRLVGRYVLATADPFSPAPATGLVALR